MLVHHDERGSPGSRGRSAGLQQGGVSAGHHFERLRAQDWLTRHGRACEARPEALRLDAHLRQDVRRLPPVPQRTHASLAGQDVAQCEPRARLHQVFGKALRAFAFQHCRMRVVSGVRSSRLPPSPLSLSSGTQMLGGRARRSWFPPSPRLRCIGPSQQVSSDSASRCDLGVVGPLGYGRE